MMIAVAESSQPDPTASEVLSEPEGESPPHFPLRLERVTESVLEPIDDVEITRIAMGSGVPRGAAAEAPECVVVENPPSFAAAAARRPGRRQGSTRASIPDDSRFAHLACGNRGNCMSGGAGQR
eukprot:GHVU01183558.1.p2 GENE.GHVU01183558.1~~GHVU01183558.1.p2  ORF type:complete len:124 (+),score=11.65 GHVU01183558.1:652-1023(+)